MVASTHWLASAAGMAPLEAGGNAFDAAVAAGLTLQVVEPHLNGPGGEVPVLFARSPRAAAGAGQPVVLSGQGPAPAGATIEAYSQLGLDLVPGTGLLAATVPGAIGAWLTLLRDHGTLPLDAVLRFAIEYAEHGHPLVPRVAATVASVSEHFRTHWPTSAATWLAPHGAPPPARRPFRNPPPARPPVPQPGPRLDLPPTARRSARSLPRGTDRRGARGLVHGVRRRGDRRVLPVPGHGRLRSSAPRFPHRSRSRRVAPDVRAAGHPGLAWVDAREGRAVVPGPGAAPGARDAGRPPRGSCR